MILGKGFNDGIKFVLKGSPQILHVKVSLIITSRKNAKNRIAMLYNASVNVHYLHVVFRVHLLIRHGGNAVTLLTRASGCSAS